MNLFEPVADARPDDRPWPPLVWPLEPQVRLRGRAVELRPFEAGRDAAALFAALDDSSAWAHVAGRPPDAATYADALSRAPSQGRFPWVVRMVRPLAGLAAGSVAGTSSYLDVSVPDARLEIGSTAYDRRVWGTVVNPEAKLLLLSHAFDVLGAGRVQLKTDVRNHRSQQAIAPPRRPLRGDASPLPATRGRHGPRHRAVLHPRRGMARRARRPLRAHF